MGINCGCCIFANKLSPLKEPVSITSIASISSLGSSQEEIWYNYQNKNHYISDCIFPSGNALVSKLPEAVQQEILELRNSDVKYKQLDDSVLYAIYVSRKAISEANLVVEDLKVDIFDKVGIATFYNNYAFIKHGNPVQGKGRVTLAFLLTQEGWKIIHEHSSPFKE